MRKNESLSWLKSPVKIMPHSGLRLKMMSRLVIRYSLVEPLSAPDRGENIACVFSR